MANKLENMGFTVFGDADKRCRDLDKYDYPLINIAWPFRNGSPVYLNIDPVNAEEKKKKIPSSLIKFDEEPESESENEEEENIITLEGYLYKNIDGKIKKIIF